MLEVVSRIRDWSDVGVVSANPVGKAADNGATVFLSVEGFPSGPWRSVGGDERESDRHLTGRRQVTEPGDAPAPLTP